MPTPVSIARQCLTPEAAHALDEAVTVARRRGHAQTTSLHAVSALLSLSPSALRDACARARNSAYSPRLQFKALELCLSVSLDRVPSSQLREDPPVSNSLMAAIKRSQANQRRQPENFHLYHQMSQQQQNTISCIKVEMRHLILSILDDPVVSRVFGEAGFRSSEIKLAIVRPLPQLLRYPPRHRGPPLCLCNLNENQEPGRRGFSFPFSGFAAFFHGDENNRRIGEVLARVKGRNPLLMGVCAYDTLNGFIESVVEKRRHDVLPKEISGLNVISIENDVSKHIVDSFDKGCVDMKFEEIGKIVEQSLGPGLVVNYGDLMIFVNDHNASDSIINTNDNCGLSNAASYFVAQLTRLLQLHEGKVWLMGSVASYEVYLKFVSRFPSIEKGWDLQILPITSLRPSLAESYPRSSLMESFVPFGGFFSTPSELKEPFNGLYQCAPRCHLCNERCEQEVIAASKGGLTASAADLYQSSLPSWLQMTELGTNKGLDVKTKDDGLLLKEKVTELQKKWDSICQCLHHSRSFTEPNTYKVGAQFPTVVGFQFVEQEKENADKCSSNDTIAAANGNSSMNENSLMPIDLHKMSTSQSDIPFPAVAKAKNRSSLSELWEKPSKPEDPDSGGFRSPCSFSNSSAGDGCRTSPSSATSVTTDLGLGISSVPASTELKKPTNQNGIEITEDFSGCFSANGDFVSGSISYHPARSSSSCPDIRGQLDPNNFKMLFRALTERVGWQDEAASVISQTIAQSRARSDKRQGASPRGNIWFNFIGPDRSGKKKIAVALADIIYGSSANFICVDLGSQDGMIHAYELSDHGQVNGYDLRFRGKTIVDYIAGELCRKPLSVIFLEHVDKADVLVQNSLSQAIQTGKFPDSHGREVGINNTIFVTTSTSTKGNPIIFSRKEPSNYSEEIISRAKGWPVQILIEHSFGENTAISNLSASPTTRKHISSSSFVNKRKLIGTDEISEQSEISEMAKRAHKTSTRNLDLNLPAEENEVQDADDGISDNVSENSKAWLQDFFDKVDENVVFKPFDFDALAEKILNDIIESFHKFVNSECLLEIDSKVMEQVLAAAYFSDRNRVVEDWVEQVLNRGFTEIQKRYNLAVRSVVKLVACEGLFAEEQTRGALLPQKIILN